MCKNGDLLIESQSPMRAVTPGQICVFYDRSVCLGGGKIKQMEKDEQIEQIDQHDQFWWEISFSVYTYFVQMLFDEYTQWFTKMPSPPLEKLKIISISKMLKSFRDQVYGKVIFK